MDTRCYYVTLNENMGDFANLGIRGGGSLTKLPFFFSIHTCQSQHVTVVGEGSSSTCGVGLFLDLCKIA